MERAIGIILRNVDLPNGSSILVGCDEFYANRHANHLNELQYVWTTRSDSCSGMSPFQIENLILSKRDKTKSGRNLNISNRITILLENSTSLMFRNVNISLGILILVGRDQFKSDRNREISKGITIP